MSAPRNPWPIGIGVFITVFALSMIAFVFWSLHHKQDLVAADYYDQELRHQEAIDQVQHARMISPDSLRYDGKESAIVMMLSPGVETARLTLYRPSSAALDQAHDLTIDVNGHARFSVKGLTTGLWRARLEWSQDGEPCRSEIAFVAE